VTRLLRERYGVAAVSVEPVPGGQDVEARVYRVETNAAAGPYLVKVRPAGAARDVAAAVTRYLHDTGVPHVVAPLRARAGTSPETGSSMTVAPFLDGRTGVDAGLSDRHWRELGAFARRLHATVLPPSLSGVLGRETYRPTEVDLARRMDAVVVERSFSEQSARDLASLWRTRRGLILEIADRTEQLGRRLERRALPLVLCHADLHTWNVLIDASDELWVVDWDEAVLAPKERDLMFVVGGIGAGLVSAQATKSFFAGYGDTTVDPLALAYYRHAWAIQDIAGYAERVLVAPSVTDEQRAEAARIFTSLFARGEIVEISARSLDP